MELGDGLMWGEGDGGNNGDRAGWSEQGDGGAFTEKRKHWGETGGEQKQGSLS